VLGDRGDFFSLECDAPLVRNGVDFRHPRDPETGAPQHVDAVVYAEMLIQICRSYSTLPDPRTLTTREIRWFYEAIRAELHELTKPKPKR
jgi:hypothetical protein